MLMEVPKETAFLVAEADASPSFGPASDKLTCVGAALFALLLDSAGGSIGTFSAAHARTLLPNDELWQFTIDDMSSGATDVGAAQWKAYVANEGKVEGHIQALAYFSDLHIKLTADSERSVVAQIRIALDTSQPLGFGINNLADGKHGVSSVKEGSQAERLGMRAGDMLVAIGGDTLADVHSMDMVTSHLRTAIGSAKAEGQRLTIILERGTREAATPRRGGDSGDNGGGATKATPRTKKPQVAALPPKPEELLAKNWVKRTDPGSGLTFWGNLITKRTTWEMPACGDASDAAATAAAAAATAPVSPLAPAAVSDHAAAPAAVASPSLAARTAQKHDAVLHARLVAFFDDVKPSKVSSVHELMLKYAGKEESMLRALERRYGKPVPAAAAVAQSASREVTTAPSPTPTATARQQQRIESSVSSTAIDTDAAAAQAQAAVPAVEVDWHFKFEVMFAEHAPHEVATISEILTHCRGQECEVFAACMSQYEEDAKLHAKHGTGSQSDGSFITRIPDGGTRQRWLDGSEYMVASDGASSGKHIDGSVSHTTSDGHRVTQFRDGSVLSEDFGTNTSMREWADGRVQQRLEDNSVIELRHDQPGYLVRKLEHEHDLPNLIEGGAQGLSGLSPMHTKEAMRALLMEQFVVEEAARAAKEEAAKRAVAKREAERIAEEEAAKRAAAARKRQQIAEEAAAATKRMAERDAEEAVAKRAAAAVIARARSDEKAAAAKRVAQRIEEEAAAKRAAAVATASAIAAKEAALANAEAERVRSTALRKIKEAERAAAEIVAREAERERRALGVRERTALRAAREEKRQSVKVWTAPKETTTKLPPLGVPTSQQRALARVEADAAFQRAAREKAADENEAHRIFAERMRAKALVPSAALQLDATGGRGGSLSNAFAALDALMASLDTIESALKASHGAHKANVVLGGETDLSDRRALEDVLVTGMLSPTRIPTYKT